MIEPLPDSLTARLLADSLDAVVILDAGGRIRYLNEAMHTLCGYAAGELLGQSFNGLLPPELAPRHNAMIAAYLGSGKPSTVMGKVREFALRHRNDEMIPIEMKALDLGASDGERFFGAFLVDLRERRAMLAKNQLLLEQLARQAMTDSLTELPNRRAFEAEALQVMARARRDGGPVTVALADIDHFKKINDQHGHAAGDLVLRGVARAIRASGRLTDMVARLGGEEFGVLLPQASLEQAVLSAERIRAAIGASVTTLPDGRRLGVTVSIGLAALPPGSTLDEALNAADKALYRAKHEGRNRVETAPAA